MGSRIRTGAERVDLDLRATISEPEESHSEPRLLLKDGVWQVPPEDRPRGWQKLRLWSPRDTAAG